MRPQAVRITGVNNLKCDIKRVTVAGESVQMPRIACGEVTVIGLKKNTGTIFVGTSNVTKDVFGVELAANESHTFLISDVGLLYIDAEVSGEGVSFVAI